MKNTLSLRISAKLVLSALLLSIFAVMAVFAQEVTGAIQGEVKDQSGAVVAGAAVTATNAQRSFNTTTDSKGEYRFANLQPGSYAISAIAKGFAGVKIENVAVELGRTIQVNMDLKVGGTNETVTVTASDESIVDVSSSKTATNITQKTIAVLPKGLNFSSVLEVAPGTRNESKAGGFQIDGASGAENTFIVDGVEVTRIVSGTLGMTKNTTLDFVKEVQVKSAGYEGEYGGATGGVINVVTKSGTNEIHGELRLEFSNDSLRAKDNPTLGLSPFDASQQTIEYLRNPRGKDSTNFFNPVFTLGGPIVKDKLWFFAGVSPQYSSLTRRTSLIKPIAAGDTTRQVLNTRDLNTSETDHSNIIRLDYAPTNKLTVFGNFIHSPIRTEGNVLGLYTTSTDSFNDPRYSFKGGYTPASQTSYGVTYTPTSRLILSFRGGRTYLNDKGGSYDIPVNTPLINISVPCPVSKFTNCGAGTTTPGTPTILTNSLTQFDITRRTNLNFDAAYSANFIGQHNLKGGYQTNLISNTVLFGNSGGVINFYFDRSYLNQRGTYGYYRVTDFARSGDVSSSNQGLFIQDGWRILPRVTLNLGLRFEKEFLPSFPISTAGHPDIPADIAKNTPAHPIDFGWTDKIAPRIGGAWDVFGDGKLKLSGSFSIYYDTMKYELPRGSFGGEVFLRTWYKLEQPDFRGITLANRPGAIIYGPVDFRYPSNVTLPGARPGVDPNLLPFKSRELSAAADYAFSNNLVLSARFTRKNLIHAIEDVGGLDAKGNEVYTIGNPGFGTTVTDFSPPTPKAVREYTGLELRLDKRFSKNWYTQASYVYSKLYGNYSGLASSDENGRTSPNVNRYFDLPEIVYDTHGKQVLGRLATDRPNTFKVFAAYEFSYSTFGRSMRTQVGGSQFVYQGIPITTSLDLNVGVPINPEGRGDLGRTPVFTDTDLVVSHFINLSERVKLRFSMNVFNLFDQRNATNIFSTYLGAGQVVAYNDLNDLLKSNGDWKKRVTDQKLALDPRYGKASEFQGARAARFAVGITF